MNTDQNETIRQRRRHREAQRLMVLMENETKRDPAKPEKATPEKGKPVKKKRRGPMTATEFRAEYGPDLVMTNMIAGSLNISERRAMDLIAAFKIQPVGNVRGFKVYPTVVTELLREHLRTVGR